MTCITQAFSVRSGIDSRQKKATTGEVRSGRRTRKPVRLMLISLVRLSDSFLSQQ